MNRVTILGRLGKDPEAKHLPTGSMVCNFSIATSDRWKDKDGNSQEKTEWHSIVAFGKLAEICSKYLEKGRQTLVEGKLQTRSWEDDSGKKHYRTDIVASNVVFLGQSGNQSTPSESAGQQVTSSTDFAVDNMQF